MKIRDLVLRVHRWAGLAVGVVVTLLSLTGAALLISAPADSAATDEMGRSAPSGTVVLPVSALIAAASAAVPEADFRSIRLARPPRHNAAVQFRDNTTVWVDPWDGSVIEVRTEGASVSGWLTHFHENLLMGQIGQTIVDLSTIAFLGLILLGLWLWWPNARTIRRALLIQPRLGLKRLNYDVHNVLGFYSAFVLVVLGVTGLMLAYPSLQGLGGRLANAIVRAPSSGTTALSPAASGVPADSTSPADSTAGAGTAPPPDRAWAVAQARFPDAPWQRLATGGGDSPRIRVEVGAEDGSHAGHFHTARFTPSGELRAVVRFGQERPAARLSRLVGELHTGSLSGAYRVAAFLACMVGAVLPITGTLIWFPRWRRRRRRATDRRAAS